MCFSGACEPDGIALLRTSGLMLVVFMAQFFVRALRWSGGTRALKCKVQNCRMQNGAGFAGGTETRISSPELPKFYSFRAYLPQQAAGRIRAEGWVLGKMRFLTLEARSRNETTYGLTPFLFFEHAARNDTLTRAA